MQWQLVTGHNAKQVPDGDRSTSRQRKNVQPVHVSEWYWVHQPCTVRTTLDPAHCPEERHRERSKQQTDHHQPGQLWSGLWQKTGCRTELRHGRQTTCCAETINQFTTINFQVIVVNKRGYVRGWICTKYIPSRTDIAKQVFVEKQMFTGKMNVELIKRIM